MRADVREYGTPPTIATFGVINARAGARVLADMLAPQEWADMAILTINYEGDGFTPALLIKLVKWPGKSRTNLQVDWVISLEDAFGLDNFNNERARDIVHQLEEAVREAMKEGPPNGNA